MHQGMEDVWLDPQARLGRRFYFVAGARSASVLGNGFGWIALTFGILAMPGGNAAALSLVLASQALPQLALTVFGGVLADRLTQGRVLVACEVVSALAWGVLALVLQLGVGKVWLLALLAAITGICSCVFNPAMAGVLPQFVHPDRLQRANALLRMYQNAALLAGLALAGMAVATLGAPAALASNAASFLISACCLGAARLPAARGRKVESFLKDLRLGGRLFFSRQWLWVFVAQYALVIPAWSALEGVLGPSISVEHYGGASTWGLITAAQAGGAIFGAGLAVRVRVRHPLFVAALLTYVVALPMLVLALRAPLVMCIAGAVTAGVANDVVEVLWMSTVQREIAPHMISRVMAYDNLGQLALTPLALVLIGPLTDALGSSRALLLCAGLVVVAASLALVSRQVRTLSLATSQSQSAAPPGG